LGGGGHIVSPPRGDTLFHHEWLTTFSPVFARTRGVVVEFALHVRARVDDIQFADTPTLERHLVGSSPLLQCVVSGLPKPQVSWRFNRQRINTGNMSHHIMSEISSAPITRRT